jgi:hypothetical protein
MNYECVKRDSFVAESWECHIPVYFLVVSRRGSVYFFWLLRETEQAVLCARHQKLGEHPVGKEQCDPRGYVKARLAYAQIMFVYLVHCLL